MWENLNQVKRDNTKHKLCLYKPAQKASQIFAAEAAKQSSIFFVKEVHELL
jgi:hypothetical protein